jgi:hypothetical protein
MIENENTRTRFTPEVQHSSENETSAHHAPKHYASVQIHYSIRTPQKRWYMWLMADEHLQINNLYNLPSAPLHSGRQQTSLPNMLHLHRGNDLFENATELN